MSNKTKAALQGRQCHYRKTQPNQNITLIDQVNRSAGGIPPTVLEAAPLTQFPKALNFVQIFGSMPRCCSSLRMIRFIQAETDASPSCAIALRIDCSNSGSTRKAICLLPLGKFVFDICCTLGLACLCQTMYNTSMTHAKQQRPVVLATHTGRLTSHVNRSNAMAKPQCNQTHPEFIWRFLAVDASTPDMRPITLYTNAQTEEEARENCPGWVLHLVARQPLFTPDIQGVHHA